MCVRGEYLHVGIYFIFVQFSFVQMCLCNGKKLCAMHLKFTTPFMDILLLLLFSQSGKKCYCENVTTTQYCDVFDGLKGIKHTKVGQTRFWVNSV